MTEEQLATLERPHRCAGTLPPCECGFAEEVAPLLPRLLEERKRLLEASREAAEDFPVSKLLAAIAFAEEALGQNGAELALAAPRRPPGSLEGQ